jgi:hypothetical protein
MRENFVTIVHSGLLVTAFVFKYIWPECARIEPHNDFVRPTR